MAKVEFSADAFNKADSVVARFRWRAFDVCKLFKDGKLNVFWKYVTFNLFSIIDTVSKDVHTCFDLGPGSGWAYVSFPIELMNMDDDKILEKYKVIDHDDGRGNRFNFIIVEKED